MNQIWKNVSCSLLAAAMCLGGMPAYGQEEAIQEEVVEEQEEAGQLDLELLDALLQTLPEQKAADVAALLVREQDRFSVCLAELLQAGLEKTGHEAKIVSGYKGQEAAEFCLVQVQKVWYAINPEGTDETEPMLLGQDFLQEKGWFLETEQELSLSSWSEGSPEQEKESEPEKPEPQEMESSAQEEEQEPAPGDQPDMNSSELEETEPEPEAKPEADARISEPAVQDPPETSGEAADPVQSYAITLYHPLAGRAMEKEAAEGGTAAADPVQITSEEDLAALFFQMLEEGKETCSFRSDQEWDLEKAFSDAILHPFLDGFARWNVEKIQGLQFVSDAGVQTDLTFVRTLSPEGKMALEEQMRDFGQHHLYRYVWRNSYSLLQEELNKALPSLLEGVSGWGRLWLPAWLGTQPVLQDGIFADVLPATHNGMPVGLLYVRHEDKGYVLDLSNPDLPVLAGLDSLQKAGYVLLDAPWQLQEEDRKTDFVTMAFYMDANPVVTAATYEDAMVQVYDLLKQGKTTIRLQFTTPLPGGWGSDFLYNYANMEIPGDGFSGAYVKRLYRKSLSYTASGTGTLTCVPFWYDTQPEDELALTEAVEAEYAAKGLKSMADADKAREIHDFILQKATYPKTDVNDPHYQTPYGPWTDLTAYKNKMVCSGYALLFYRMSRDCGLDAKYVVGSSRQNANVADHGWNLVSIDGTYYCVDATWDDNLLESGGESYRYTYFLKGTDHFSSNHLVIDYEGSTAPSDSLISKTDFTCFAGHVYDAKSQVQFAWSGQDACLVRFTCSVCGRQTGQVQADVQGGQVVQKVARAATCQKEGELRCSVQVKLQNKTASDSCTFPLERLPHVIALDDASLLSWPNVTDAGSYTFSCANCPYSVTERADPVLEVQDATCTQGGTIKGKLLVSHTDDQGQVWEMSTTKTETLSRLGHDVKALWSWTTGNEMASAALSCTRCSWKRTASASVSSTRTEATCRENGQMQYSASVSATDDLAKKWVFTSRKNVTLARLGHDVAFVWDWQDDGVQAMAQCSRCDWQKEQTGTRTSTVAVLPTCTTEGVQKVTASASITDDLDRTWTDTDTRNASLEKLGHAITASWNWKEDGSSATASARCSRCAWAASKAGSLSGSVVKAATCTTAGSKKVLAAATSFTDDLGKVWNLAASSRTVSLSALGHDVSFSWSWKDDGSSAAASGRCSRCSWTASKAASLSSSVTKAATCTAAGSRQVNGSVSMTDDRGKVWTATSSRTVSLAKLGHAVQTGWSWNSAGTSATASAKCSRCAWAASKAGSLSGSVVKAATCTAAGSKKVRAAATSFTDDLGKVWNLAASSRTVSVPSLGHAWSGYVCSRCKILQYGKTDVYRLYNPNSGEHFYTMKAGERDMLKKAGWKYEGVGWTAPVKTALPVYRVYNPNNGDHHYTMNVHEYNHLGSVGWNKEGIAWYSDPGKGEVIYRLYNPNCAGAGSHHYTSNLYEYQHLKAVGWRQEGLAWHGVFS